MFIITFDLLNAHAVDLTGTASATGPNGSTNVRLTGPGGDLFNTGSIISNTVPVAFNGVLPPGQYTLYARMTREDTDLEWIEPLTVGAGPVQIDLDEKRAHGLLPRPEE